ncbi:ABC transporter permease [Enterococcus faecalis]|uniref:ABC transporter permease n=1 Tax=Enterococcus faecalis TaxID=1351 RepID=UPI0035CA5DD4
MNALCKRNLKIYFSNSIAVFFSLLGALIVFGLYLLFLRKNMVTQFDRLTDGPSISDFWVLGGLLATTSITTSFAAVSQFVKDKAENKFMDFIITGKKASHLLSGYFLSGVIISFCMQVVVLILCLVYFQFQENNQFTFIMGLKAVGIILLSSLNATAINLIVCTFIKTESTLLTINNILGAISGFMCTAYLPIGSFSGFTEIIIKILPISYASSSFRRIFISPIITDMPHEQLLTLKEYLGIGYTWNNHISTSDTDIIVLITSSVFCLLILYLCGKKIAQLSLS